MWTGACSPWHLSPEPSYECQHHLEATVKIITHTHTHNMKQSCCSLVANPKYFGRYKSTYKYTCSIIYIYIAFIFYITFLPSSNHKAVYVAFLPSSNHKAVYVAFLPSSNHKAVYVAYHGSYHPTPMVVRRPGGTYLCELLLQVCIVNDNLRLPLIQHSSTLHRGRGGGGRWRRYHTLTSSPAYHAHSKKKQGMTLGEHNFLRVEKIPTGLHTCMHTQGFHIQFEE